MIRTILLVFFILNFSANLKAQRLKVSQNGRFLVTEAGKPFFWQADTAWELFHRNNREEVDEYLKIRAEQGFNVIQAVILAELDGLNTPNAYGETPLIDNNPLTPNPKYFEQVDYVIKKARESGMYIALLPTWGDKVYKNRWGVGPVIFNTENAKAYGKWIGDRYKDYDNVVWIMGGDRNPRENTDDVAIWRQMAEGVVEGVGGNDMALMSFHPQPKDKGGSSTWFQQDKWLDLNMHQTGHCANQGTYKHISYDYQLSPTKPILDGEPLYEDHPNCFNAKELGYSVPEDIRRIMYWNVFAGACGQTYGCHDVWQMYTLDKEGVNGPLRPWTIALDLPMANQVKHLKNLMLSRPYLSRIPDQSMVVDTQGENNDYVIATRDEEGTYAMVYFPTGKAINLDLSSLFGNKLNTWWYDPRTGNAYQGGDLKKSANIKITPPTNGKGNDWVLVVDADKNHFTVPGQF